MDAGTLEVIAIFPGPAPNRIILSDGIFVAFPDVDPLVGHGREDRVSIILPMPQAEPKEVAQEVVHRLEPVVPEGSSIEIWFPVATAMPEPGLPVACRLLSEGGRPFQSDLVHVLEDDVTWRTADDLSELSTWYWTVVFWRFPTEDKSC